MYFSHVLTMAEKCDWTPSLHEDYLELMVETLLKTREIVLTEILSTELFTEIERRGSAHPQGIARLGHALTSRTIATSEAVDELCVADEDGNSMMSSTEFLNYSANQFLSECPAESWHQIHDV